MRPAQTAPPTARSLIFDDGGRVAPPRAGGATELFGAQPDLACFAKAIGGGTPTAAYRRRRRGHGRHRRTARGVAGHLQRQPPVAAAIRWRRATEVLPLRPTEHMVKLGARLRLGVATPSPIIAILATVVDLVAGKYRPEPLRNSGTSSRR